MLRREVPHISRVAEAMQQVSAAAKAVSAVASNGCRGVDRLKFSIGWTSPWLCRQPRLLADSADHAHLFQHAQKKGWDAPGVLHIGKILGTTRQLWMAMLHEAKPDNEPRRHGLRRRRDRKRRVREFVRADLKGCSNAGFFMLPPQSRIPRKVPAKLQSPRLHQISQHGHYADNRNAINRATPGQKRTSRVSGRANIRRAQLTGSASGNLHAPLRISGRGRKRRTV